jgi:hypothetical protein
VASAEAIGLTERRPAATTNPSRVDIRITIADRKSVLARPTAKAQAKLSLGE